MKKKLWILAAVLAICLAAALPASAADVFSFTEKSISLFESEIAETALKQEGAYIEGEIVYSSESPRVATVAEDGTVTAVSKGTTDIIADLMRNGKRVRRAYIEVKVIRRVTKVTLSRKNMVVLEPDDPILADLLAPVPEGAEPNADPVIVVPAGRSVNLSVTCTPEDANSRRVTYTSSDAGIAKIVDDDRLRGVEKGECDLTVASVQNPEVQEHFHVVVVEPVKKIQISAPDKNMFVGTQMQLSTSFTPENAGVRKVTWSSGRTSVATVDENGLVTALAKGEVTIEAKAMDGTGVTASFRINVQQDVTEITLKETDLVLSVKKSVYLEATALPRDANNKKMTWTSSDETIATVGKDGRVTGKKAGYCVITCTSESNPAVSAEATIRVVQPVTKITFNATSGISLPDHNTLQLSWNVEPADADIKELTFKSRRPEIATVDENGIVTGLAKGEVTIEAKATDGSGVSASVRLNVQQDVTGITLKQTDLVLSVKKSVQLEATVLPKDANNKKLIWTSSDETIATVGKDGRVTGKKAGYCVITCTSENNPAISASVSIRVVQPVTKITFNSPSGQSFPIHTTMQLSWNVEPYDADIKEVTFKSNHPEIATVDENGLVTGIKRGEARITATATDGSRCSGDIRVIVTQPVEGVMLQQQMYYVQRGRELYIRATVLPKDANNQRVYWETGDESMATVRSSGTSTGRVTGGYWSGTTTITAITEDGGYTASANIKVADFDGAVQVEGLEIGQDNKIRITLRNTSDLIVERVYMHIDCYDLLGNPMVYNTDGITTGFDAVYPLALQSGERSIHGRFWFNNYMETGLLGQVVVTITGYQFENGQRWDIPVEYRVPTLPARSVLYGTVTPTPMPPQNPNEGDGNG